MYVPEMYRFVMYYFQISCTIDLQVTIPGIGVGVGVCPRKRLKNGCKPIFCRLNFVYRLLIYSRNCGYFFFFFALKAPIFVLRENFHISCWGSYKVQEGSFYPLVVVCVWGGEGGGLPRYFYFEKRMQMVLSEPFLGRLLVSIFSKIVADFCHDFEFTLYIEGIFPLPWKGGGVPFSFY